MNIYKGQTLSALVRAVDSVTGDPIQLVDYFVEAWFFTSAYRQIAVAPEGIYGNEFTVSLTEEQTSSLQAGGLTLKIKLSRENDVRVAAGRVGVLLDANGSNCGCNKSPIPDCPSYAHFESNAGCTTFVVQLGNVVTAGGGGGGNCEQLEAEIEELSADVAVIGDNVNNIAENVYVIADNVANVQNDTAYIRTGVDAANALALRGIGYVYTDTPVTGGANSVIANTGIMITTLGNVTAALTLIQQIADSING